MGRSARVVCLLAVCALLAGALPAAAAERWSAGLNSRWTPIEHLGVAYEIRLQAETAPSGDYLFVTLRRRVDPDGAGPISSIQQHHWSFRNLDRAVVVSNDLATGSLRARQQLSPHGTASYAFAASAAGEQSCGGGFERRRGRLTGQLEMDTRSNFGVVKVGNLLGEAWWSSMRCDPSSNGSGWQPPCLGSEGVMAFRERDQMAVDANRYDTHSTFPLSTSYWRDIPFDAPNVDGTISRSVTTRLPAEHLVVSDDLRSASVRGAPGTFHRGSAEFRGSGPMDGGSGAGVCGESSMDMRHGYLSGTLRATFGLGREFDLSDGRQPGLASREYYID